MRPRVPPPLYLAVVEQLREQVAAADLPYVPASHHEQSEERRGGCGRGMMYHVIDMWYTASTNQLQARLPCYDASYCFPLSSSIRRGVPVVDTAEASWWMPRLGSPA